jgi:hypothetical protein
MSSCGIYSADEITATVVDADTKFPIAGVNVVAAWIVRGGVNFGATVGYKKVMETVTDQNGKFHLPSWGPKPNFYLGEVRQEAPVLMLFKSGYRYTATQNQGGALTAAPNAMKSHWNKQTIPMKRYAGMKPDYDAGFIPLLTDIEDLKRHGHWTDIPRFLCALGHEHKALSGLGVPNLLYSFEALNSTRVDCPDA